MEKELTLWEKLVWLDFNPSGTASVNKVKRMFADMIDMLEPEWNTDASMAKQVIIGHAVMCLLWAQMAVVKLLRWKDQ